MMGEEISGSITKNTEGRKEAAGGHKVVGALQADEGEGRPWLSLQTDYHEKHEIHERSESRRGTKFRGRHPGRGVHFV
jgi:hypothetical protein